MAPDTTLPQRKRGRPHKHLLSGIAVCGSCEAPLRLSTQSSGAIPTARGSTPAVRYTVYECSKKYDVSIKQAELDQIVSNAVLARIRDPNFVAPYMRRECNSDEEKRRLTLLIKAQKLYIEKSWKMFLKHGLEEHHDGVRSDMEHRIHLNEMSLERLTEQHPGVELLLLAESIDMTWAKLPIGGQRNIVEALLTPRVLPLPPFRRGQREGFHDRVDLVWRDGP